MFFNPIVKRVFGQQNDSGIPAANALLYLVRRFGYTEYGSDPYKDVCGYCFPLELFDLFIDIGGRTAFFGVSMSEETSMGLHSEMLQQERPFTRKCEEIVEKMLLDLLRPVRVRDIFVNILGECDPAGEFDPETGLYTDEVSRFYDAGRGVSHPLSITG